MKGMAALPARSAETSAADCATGVAGQASRRYAYAPFAPAGPVPVAARVPVKA